jgi:hypothetical protein
MTTTLRLSRRRDVGVLLASAVAAAALGRVLAQSPARVVGAVGELLMIIAPIPVAGAVLAAARRVAAGRPDDAEPRPANPPIELVAADLRRLLWQHDLMLRADMTNAAKHLWALEVVITRRAVQAARALRVPHPRLPAEGGFDRPRLRALLRALAAEGLAIPLTVGLMAPDTRG